MTAPDPWCCTICGRHYVTPSLARDCETRHTQEPT